MSVCDLSQTHGHAQLDCHDRWPGKLIRGMIRMRCSLRTATMFCGAPSRAYALSAISGRLRNWKL